MRNLEIRCDPIGPEARVSDIIRRYPATRRVFDRYGLHGCGGPFGPAEPLRTFAHAHGVDQAALLEELRVIEAAGESPEPAPATVGEPALEDRIYRRFFIAAILTTLTAGATWGAWLLWKVAVVGSFTGVSIHEVNAHGDAQVYGWVGLFIMGFALQAMPRMWGTTLWRPGLARWVFGLTLAGVVLRSIGMVGGPGLDGGGSSPTMLGLATAGGALLIIGVALFTLQITATLRRSGVRIEPYIGFILAALTCFLGSAVLSVWHTAMTMQAMTKDQLLNQVATWQAPLRDLQIHGMMAMMILGVSMRMLPAFYDLKPASRRRGWTALTLLSLGIAAEVGFFLAYRLTQEHGWAAGLEGAWLVMAIGAAIIVLPWRLWRPPVGTDHLYKFAAGSYAWLGVFFTLMLGLPLYLKATGQPFSHAYYGAATHAITVGFVSLMIMGFGAKVVTTLAGMEPEDAGGLWGPFVLVNLGCAMRVGMQAAIDTHPGLYALIGFSGVLEVTALAWWGAGLIRIMLRRGEPVEELGGDSAPPAQILATHRVAQVLDWYPQAEPVLIRHGFTALRNPVLRRTTARKASLATAARLRGADLQTLLAELNEAVRGSDR